MIGLESCIEELKRARVRGISFKYHLFMNAGDQLGNWEVVDTNFMKKCFGKGIYPKTLVRCKCLACGITKYVHMYDLMKGRSVSCNRGCFLRVGYGKVKIQDSRLLNWRQEKAFQENIMRKDIKRQGCSWEWSVNRISFFKWVIKQGFGVNGNVHLNLKDKEGMYSADNCSLGRMDIGRKSKVLYGESKTITEWLEDTRCRVNKGRLYEALKRGVSFEDAFEGRYRRERGQPSAYESMNDRYEKKEIRQRSGLHYEAYGENKTFNDWMRDDRCRTTLHYIKKALQSGVTFQAAFDGHGVKPLVRERLERQRDRIPM